jgi:hypothetical protein
MSILDELSAARIDTTNWPAILTFIGSMPIPRDRREGLLRLAASALNRVPTILEIEQVRARPSP